MSENGKMLIRLPDIFDYNKLSSAYKFYLPWVRDGSGNVQDKSYNGDAVKGGTGSVAQVKGYFTTLASGTYGSGHLFQVAAATSHVELATHTLVFHATVNKSAPASVNEYICGTQSSSSTPGLLLMASPAGALSVYYRYGNVQCFFPAVAGVFDGTDRGITVVIDRDTSAGADPAKTYRTGYLYVDGVLQSTLQIDCSGAVGVQQKFTFGGSQIANVGVACKFANVHLLGIPLSVTDLPVQRIVDEFYLRSAAITASLVGV